MRLTLGTAQLGAPYGVANRRGRPTDSEVDAILTMAVEHGVRSLDTAPEYGDAESRIGDWLRRYGRPDGLQLCTKLPQLSAGVAAGEIDAAVERALDGSRRRLGVETVDVYLVHAVGDLHEHGAALRDSFARLEQAGRIGRAGVSVYDPADVDALFARPGLSAVQYPFNLFDRRIPEGGRIERLARGGVATFARSPLLQGLLAMPADAVPSALRAARPALDALGALCDERKTTPFALSLAYSAARSGADHIVLGVESTEQLITAAETLATPLASTLTDEIDRAFADVPPEITDPRRWNVS